MIYDLAWCCNTFFFVSLETFKEYNYTDYTHYFDFLKNIIILIILLILAR